MLTFQDIIFKLQKYWAQQGCMIAQPLDIEVGAGTFHPMTFLRAIGPNDWNAAYVQSSRRPTDSRYGDNPNRSQHYYQFQVMMKPSPINFQELYLDSLKALGIDTLEHDIRFVEDNWESPTLRCMGLRLGSMDKWYGNNAVTYFQQVGGFECNPVTGEITYGLERLAMYLQNVDNMYDLLWTNGTKKPLYYRDIFQQNERELSQYNFEEANIDYLLNEFDFLERESQRLLTKKLPLLHMN